MKTSYHSLVLIPPERRDKWKDRLCNSIENASCDYKGCVVWDSGYNAAADEPLNTRREKDQENYFAWMEDFCKHLDPEVEKTLDLLKGKGGCMPCIGRLIFLYLRSECLKEFMVPQEEIEILRQSPDFPDNLRKPIGRRERGLRDGFMDWQTHSVITEVAAQCKRPHYAHLALLLNHGGSFPSHLLDGVFGADRFHLIEVEYSESMLRSRANRADPLATFTSIVDLISPEALHDLIPYLRNMANDLPRYPHRQKVSAKAIAAAFILKICEYLGITK